MTGFRFSLGAFAVACVMSACSNSPKNSAQAPLLITDSFVIAKESDHSKKNTLIGIKRTSLDKEFLLQGEIIQQPIVAKYSNIKSRIVMFHENSDHVSMMEAIDGYSSSSSLPQNIVLTRFKVVKEDSGVLYFDFSEGMSRIFVSEDWYASDSSGTAFKADKMWKTVSLSTNFIESADTDSDNNLIIRQIAQIQSSQKLSDDDEDKRMETTQIPVEVKYYLSPYRENAGFVSRESTKMTGAAYFEVMPRLISGGGTKVLASRWDERKPVTYSISENTPAEYVQAIKDGVLYWNKAFGKEVLRVTMAPKGVVAPDFHYNLIQWVDWNDAGYAYADAQMDPRTGEILHASVFLTSVFGFSAKNKAHQILRRLNYEKSKIKTDSTRLALAGFQQKHLCEYEVDPNLSIKLAQVLEDIESGKTDETALLKIAQDTIRETVAHEIGHTLGLRHNFAGSLATNIPNNQRDQILKDYLVNGKAPENFQTSSSVMDYQLFQESLISGDQVAQSKSAFEYDAKAIEQLYFGKKPEAMPLFCTDTHIGKYADCAVFDYGPSAFEYFIDSEKKAFENLPYSMMEKFIAAKTTAKSLNSALQSSVAFVIETMKNRLSFLKTLKEDAQFLKTQSTFTGDDDKTYLLAEIQKAGGLNAFLNPSRAELIQKAEAGFESLLNSDVYTRNEGTFEFTAEDKAMMKRLAKSFFTNLNLGIPLSELIIYGKSGEFRDTLASELAEIFAKRASYILFTSMGHVSGEVIAKDGSTVKVEVPMFLFPDSFRKEAAKLLNGRSDDPMWGYKAKAALRKQFKTIIEKGFKNVDFDNLQVENLNDELGSWVLINRQVMELLKP